MRPEDTRVWRKGIRRQLQKGRRTTHYARPNKPRPGSTWARRHLHAKETAR